MRQSQEDEIQIRLNEWRIGALFVEADSMRIYEVISNLLTNVLTFTKVGRIVVIIVLTMMSTPV